MNTTKKQSNSYSKRKSLASTDYFTRNAPMMFFTNKRKAPFESSQIKPSSAFKTQASRRQSLATTQPNTFNNACMTLHQPSKSKTQTNEDDRINGLIDFFGSIDFVMNKGQFAFALYSLGYLTKPTLSALDEQESKLTQTIFNNLSDKQKKMVSLELLIKFIKTIEALDSLGMSLNRTNCALGTKNMDKYKSPKKENTNNIMHTEITFNNLHSKVPNKDVHKNMGNNIGRFSFGSENFNTLNRPINSNPKTTEKDLLFIATVDLVACKKKIKVFKGDSIQNIAKNFADTNKLTDKQYQKLLKSLMKRFDNVLNSNKCE